MRLGRPGAGFWLKLLFVLAACFVWRTCANMGGKPSAEDRKQFMKSENYAMARFKNRHVYDASETPERDRAAAVDPETGQMKKPSFGDALRLLAGRDPALPAPFPVERRTRTDFPDTPEDFAVAWLGHATFLVDIGGVRLLFDPIFGNASPLPLPFVARRLQPPPLARSELPPVDAVVISHDHYDHLEAATARFYAKRGVRFIVPLGIGARLRAWGVKPADITELDWFESAQVKGATLTSLPAHHHSMRSFSDRYSTLWCAWAAASADHRVFFAGDGGYDGDFHLIGERYGPFDLALIGIGAYNARWAENHLFPEQAVRVSRELRAARMLPMHWATYRLAPHPWDEPILRAEAAAAEAGVELVVPRIGGIFRPGDPPPERWW